MKTLQEIQDYVWSGDPACRKWDVAKFDKWVAWHFSNGFICTVLDFDDSIAGLVMIRPIMEPMDAFDPLCFDYEGRGLHVSQMVCTRKHAMQALGFAVLKRFGMREFVSWNRRPSNKLVVHEAARLRQNLFRLENHGTINS